MGKKRRAEKLKQNMLDYTLIKAMGEVSGVEVLLLNEYPMHLRLKGERIVDYWPSTRRAWEYGSEYQSAVKVNPEEVVTLTLSQNLLSPEAQEHLRSIK
jgi:hypothetical protein